MSFTFDSFLATANGEHQRFRRKEKVRLYFPLHVLCPDYFIVFHLAIISKFATIVLYNSQFYFMCVCLVMYLLHTFMNIYI